MANRVIWPHSMYRDNATHFCCLMCPMPTVPTGRLLGGTNLALWKYFVFYTYMYMKIWITLQHNKWGYWWPLLRCSINVSEVNKHFSLKQGSTNFQKCCCHLQIVSTRSITCSKFHRKCGIQNTVTWDCGPPACSIIQSSAISATQISDNIFRVNTSFLSILLRTFKFKSTAVQTV
jgi:hypothetical protein